MGEARGREILCSPRCLKDCHSVATWYKFHPVQSSLADPRWPCHSSPCLILQYREKKKPNAERVLIVSLADTLWGHLLYDLGNEASVRRPACGYLPNERSVISFAKGALRAPLQALGAEVTFCTFLYYHSIILLQDSHKTSVNSLTVGLFFPKHAIKEAKPRASSCMLMITLNSCSAGGYPAPHMWLWHPAKSGPHSRLLTDTLAF